MYSTLILVGLGIFIICLLIKIADWTRKLVKSYTNPDKNNEQFDKKTMAFLNELAGIHFWMTIIGFYFLVKIIIAIIKIIAILILGLEINSFLQDNIL